MAYVTGLATSGSDLATAIKNACAANGWTVASDVVYKGNVFVEIEGDWVPNALGGATGVSFLIGTGQSGGVLSGAVTEKCGLKADIDRNPPNIFSLTYPCTYYVFINTSPDAVTIAVNFSADKWQTAGFGQATLVSNLTGTGAFCFGLHGGSGTYDDPANSAISSSSQTHPPCFYGLQFSNTTKSAGYLNLGLDSRVWWSGASGYGGGTNYYITSQPHVYPYLQHQPNTWNNEAVLIRNWVLAQRASSFFAYVAEIPHIRFLRNDYIDAAEILSFGSDDWFIIPTFKKDAVNRNGGSFLSSGTMAYAIRKVV